MIFNVQSLFRLFFVIIVSSIALKKKANNRVVQELLTDLLKITS